MLYTPDERDTVIREAGFPPPLDGAPWPTVVATEHRLLLAYYTEVWHPEPAPKKRLQMPLLVSESSLGTVAIVDFRHPVAFFSVPVSNKTFDAHPLAFRGLAGYGVFRVENSSWIRRLAAIQYCHDRPNPGALSPKRHYIFVFHDSVFEAAADALEVKNLQGSMGDAQDQMSQTLRARLV
jgi:hypothetical protein